jgi:hypothetical protein
LLRAACTLRDIERPHLLCPSSEQADALLCLRLLHFDLVGTELLPGSLSFVQGVQASKASARPEILRLAALVGSRPTEIVVLRQNLLEQVERFVNLHPSIPEPGANEVSDPHGCAADEVALRLARACKKALITDDLFGAFGQLYQLQKHLRLTPAPRRVHCSSG